MSYYISRLYKGSWNMWVRQVIYIEPNHANKKLSSSKHHISELNWEGCIRVLARVEGVQETWVKHMKTRQTL